MNGMIIVTGESRGLGLTIARKILDDMDCSVVGLSRSETEALRSYGNKYHHIRCDLSHPESIKELYHEELKGRGPIVGLVNNSAIAYDDIITNMDLAKLREMYEVNVFSAMALTKLVIRDMIGNNTKGSIVHITSVCAHTGYKGLSMYASTKGAIESFSRTVAREWGGYGIRSNCIAPGFMDTEMSAGLKDNERNRIYARTSLKEATDIESVAEMALFLLSAKSKSATGQVFHIDNGTI